MDMMEEYVGVRPLSVTLGVSAATIYKWVAEGLIEDRRDELGFGTRHFFDFVQVLRATALAPASKARSWTRTKYLADKPAFDRALLRYFDAKEAAGGRSILVPKKHKLHYVVDVNGYFEGWDFGKLEKYARRNWETALKLQEDYYSGPGPERDRKDHAEA